MKKTNLKETLKQIVGVLLFGYVCIAEAVSTGYKKFRTLPKKVMAVCVAAALVVAMVPAYVFAAETTYDIWVGGVQVTSDNLVIDINDNAAISGSATYDPATSTLTLDDFSYTGAGYVNGKELVDGVVAAAIYSADDLNILLEGDSVITHVNSAYNGVSCGIASMKDLTIADAPADGIGTLTVTSGADCNVSAGIYAYDNVTITGGIINATGDVASYTSTGILANWNNIIISGGEVTAVGKNSNEYSTGLIALWNITISDATVNATAGDAYDAYSIRAGICAYGGKVAISNSKVEATTSDEFGNGICANDGLTIIGGTVTASGDYGIYTAGALTIEGGTVTAKGSEAGIYVENNITIDSGTVKATASGDYGIGIVAYAVTVNGGTVEAISTGEYGYGMTFYDAPTLNGTLAVYAGDDAASATAADAEASETYKNRYIKIIPACTVTVHYGIDGVDNKEIAVTKGDTISLESPVIDGHIFMGWFTDADFTTAFDFDTPITVATTVYAKFADYEDDKAALQDAIDALEADVTELNKLTENGGTIAQINAKISSIESQVSALDALKNKYAEADTALKQELQAADTAINNAITALTNRVDALEDEIDDLQTDVSANAADIAENAAELAALSTSLTNLSNTLTNDYATKAELTNAINSAKETIEQAIDALTTRVQTLEAGLAEANSKIDTNTSDVGTLKSDVAALKTWKTEAQDAINALKTLTGTQGTDIANLKLAVQDLEADLAAANARIDDAENRIAVLEGKVSALETAKQNLEAAVAALNAAIADKADTATLNQKVTDLIAAIAAAEDAAKTYADGKDTALQTQLTAAIATAKGEAITAAENLVNTAKAELQNAINSKADIGTLNTKVSELNAAIETAEATAKAYTDSAVTTLNAAIITAKDEAVNAAKDLVDAAKAELQSAIDTKADAATVNVAIANLQNAITALENAKDNYVSADAALKAELEAAIAKAKQEAIDAAKGHIPYIGTNGNWWIGDTDTGVDANGIKGDKGDKGDTGADGVGIAKIEKTATNGNVDTYTVTLTNGKTYTFTVTNGKDGANGKDGENGKDGADGKDGLTPFIGENGNWWIGDADTGVKAAADDSIPVGSGNVTEAEDVDTVTVVAIVIAGIALLGNVLLAVLVLKKKKSLV